MTQSNSWSMKPRPLAWCATACSMRLGGRTSQRRSPRGWRLLLKGGTTIEERRHEGARSLLWRGRRNARPATSWLSCRRRRSQAAAQLLRRCVHPSGRARISQGRRLLPVRLYLVVAAVPALHCAKFAPNAKGDAHLNLVTPTRDCSSDRASHIASRTSWRAADRPGDVVRLDVRLQAPMARLQRHRLFETSFPLEAPRPCQHAWVTIGVYGAHNRDRRRPAGTNHRSGSNRPREHAFIAMGVPVGSMTLAELSEAIPPAYSRYIAETCLSLIANIARTNGARRRWRYGCRWARSLV